MTIRKEMPDHVHVPVVTDEAPNHAALSLTICRICLEPLEYQAHSGAPARVKITEEEPEAVLV